MKTPNTAHSIVLVLCIGTCFAQGDTQYTCSADEPSWPVVVLDMDTVKHHPTAFGKEKQLAGTVDSVPGKVGDACRFRFVENARSGFFTAGVKATPRWDEAAGLSFWVKGDGSSNWGGLELIDRSDFKLRYAYCFPLDSTEWRQVTIPWCDLVPELPAGKPVDPAQGYAPSGFGNLWFGKWFYWGSYPAQSFTVDQISLEKSIPVDTQDYAPTVAGTPRLLAKLRAKQPVTLVTMGDSLSDERHWANRDVLWSGVLADRIKKGVRNLAEYPSRAGHGQRRRTGTQPAASQRRRL